MYNDFALIFQTVTRRGLLSTNLSYDSSRAHPLLVTHHPLHDVDGQKLIGAGRRLSTRDLSALRQLLDDAAPDGEGWIEDNLLYRSRNQMVWFVPGRIRPMHFKLQGLQPFSLDFHWPNLVFRYHTEQGFTLAAYAQPGRPTPNTLLYHAPLMNIYGDGRLCLGSATGSDELSADGRRAWEVAVFDSAFTHRNHDHLIRFGRTIPDDPDADYLGRVRQKARSGKPFFSREMVSLNQSLGNWISATPG